MIKITEFPASLDQCNFWIVNQEWDGAPEEVRLRLEISIEDGHIVTQFDIAVLHSFFECPSFVSISVLPDLILYVYAFTSPSLAFHLHHILWCFGKKETKWLSGHKTIICS